MTAKINKKIVIYLILVFLAAGFCFLFILNNKENEAYVINDDPVTVTDERIKEILKTNLDVTDYIERNPDFYIQGREILTKDSILAGQNGNDFQPVYIGLDLEDSRYMKVWLINQFGNEGYIAVIDFKDSSVQKAYGLLLFQASSGMTSGDPQEITVP